MTKPNFALRTECRGAEGRDRRPTASAPPASPTSTARATEFFQPAEIVVLSAYVLHNVQLMLLSGIGKPYDPSTGKGVVGKNYAYQTMSSVERLLRRQDHQPVHRRRRAGPVIDDFNGDNFDHPGLGFIGGGYIAGMRHRRPADRDDLHARGHAQVGPASGSRPRRKNYLRSLDHQLPRLVHERTAATTSTSIPTYRDSFGRPMLRMTFDFTDNELKMSDYLTDKAAEIAKAMDAATSIKPNHRTGVVERRALPDHPQHRRHDHGRQPDRQRGQQVPAELGRAEPVRDWAPAPSRRTPATTRPARWPRWPTSPPTRSRRQYLKAPAPLVQRVTRRPRDRMSPHRLVPAIAAVVVSALAGLARLRLWRRLSRTHAASTCRPTTADARC